jgi:type I restriction enzyme S subunit
MKFEKLRNIIDIKKGKKPSFIDIPDEDSFRVLQIDDLRNDSNPKYTNEKSGVYAKDDDVLIAWDGANAGTIGFGKSGYIGSTIALLRKKQPDIYSTVFLGIFLQSQYQYLRSKTTGATIPHISRNVLENLEVPVISMNDQLYIAHILSKAENLISQRKESIRLLDEFLKSTFLHMFGDPIKNKKRWDEKKLGELCVIRRGASPRPISDFIGTDIPWIKIGDGTKGNDLYIENTAVSVTIEGSLKSVLLEEGSLVFANCGVSLGFARILKIKGCIHDGWLSFEKIKENLNKIFLLKLLNNSTEYLRRIAPDGTQPNLNTGIMKSFKVILPPLERQNQFAQIVEKTEALKAQYQQSLRELENLYGSLSQRAFRGELSYEIEKTETS